MKVFKVELFILDYEGKGKEQIGYDLSTDGQTVMEIQEAEATNETLFDDEGFDKYREAYKKLFKENQNEN